MDYIGVQIGHCLMRVTSSGKIDRSCYECLREKEVLICHDLSKVVDMHQLPKRSTYIKQEIFPNLESEL